MVLWQQRLLTLNMTSVPLPLIADFCTWNPRANSLVSLCSHIFTYKIYLSKNTSYIHGKLSTYFINIIGWFSFYFASVLKSRLHLGLMCEVKGLFLSYSLQMVFSPAYFPTVSWFDFLLSSPSCHAGFYEPLTLPCTHILFPFPPSTSSHAPFIHSHCILFQLIHFFLYFFPTPLFFFHSAGKIIFFTLKEAVL